MSNTKRFTCYISWQVNKVTGNARKLFHNDEIISLTFADVGKVQDLIPHYGNKLRFLTLSSWESQTPYSIDTITKKLEFLGMRPYYIEVAEDGTRILLNQTKVA